MEIILIIVGVFLGFGIGVGLTMWAIKRGFEWAVGKGLGW